MAGAGAAEAIVSILAINHGIIPPTINYANPDPECDLDYVPNTARKVILRQCYLTHSVLGVQTAVWFLVNMRPIKLGESLNDMGLFDMIILKVIP